MEDYGFDIITFPSLHMPDGNVLIRLSNRTEDDILLTSSLLKDALYFQRILKGDVHWSQDRHAKDAKVWIRGAGEQDDEAVHLFSLRYIGDEPLNPTNIADDDFESWHAAKKQEDNALPHRAFMLEAGPKSAPRDHRSPIREHFPSWRDNKNLEISDYGVIYEEDHAAGRGRHFGGLLPFHKSSFSAGFAQYDVWASKPDEPRHLAHEHAIISHKVLFALLIGKTLEVRKVHPTYVIRCATDVTALAQAYDVLPIVAPRIAAFIKMCPGVWSEFSTANPAFFISLAIKLRDQEIFWAAIRHYSARFCYDCHGYDNTLQDLEMAIADELPDWDLRDIAMKHRHQLAKKSNEVMNAVRSELLSSRYHPDLGHKDALFLGRAAPRSSRQAGTFLAKSLFSEWLNNELWTLNNQHRCPDCASINGPKIITTLLDDRSNYSPALFGEEAVRRFSETFRLGYSQARGYGERHHNKSGGRGNHSFGRGHDDFYDRELKNEEEHIQNELRNVRDKICDAIEACLRPIPRMQSRYEATGQANHAQVPYFTFVAEDDQYLPWDASNPWPTAQGDTTQAGEAKRLKRIYKAIGALDIS